MVAIWDWLGYQGGPAWGRVKEKKLKRRDYFMECSRLSDVVAEKNDAFTNFIANHPNPVEDDFEQFDAHQAELSKAIGEWQRFCEENRSKLTN